MRLLDRFLNRRPPVDPDPNTETAEERERRERKDREAEAERERERLELQQRIHDATQRLHILEFKADVQKRLPPKGERL